MYASHKQYCRRLVGRIAVVVGVGIGLVTAPTTVAVADTVEAFAYQVSDCSTAGTDFGVALGTPDEPIGPVKANDLSAEAMKVGGHHVRPLPLRGYDNDPAGKVRWATVEPGLDFDFVKFTWFQGGELVSRFSPSPQPEVCDGSDATSGPTADPGAGLTPISPVRLLDTRIASQPGIDQVAAGKILSVKVAGANGVPANATAAMLNVTAVNPAAPGFLTVFPCGVPVPLTSNINYVLAENRAGAVFSQVGSSGEVCVYTSAATNVVVDLNGYVADSASPSAFTPIRVVDTRPDALTDVFGTPKGKQTAMRLPLGDLGIPDASILIVNITTVGADAPGHINLSGCLQPDDGIGPRVSFVNYVPGRPQANLAFVQVVGDEICVAASAPTHMIIDLVGATTGATPLLGAAPVGGRLLDTRAGQRTSDGRFQGVGQLKANVPFKLKVRDRLYAAGATAAALNITAVNESSYGHVTVYPCGLQPVASNLNYVPATAIANVALSRLDADGNVCIVSHVDIDLVVDLAAVTSGAVQSAQRPTIIRTDSWFWSTEFSPLLWSQKPAKVTSKLTGGKPPYIVSGPAIAGLRVRLTPAGTLETSVAPGKYVIGEPEFTLTDSAGHSQTLRPWILFDPQLTADLFPVF